MNKLRKKYSDSQPCCEDYYIKNPGKIIGILNYMVKQNIV